MILLLLRMNHIIFFTNSDANIMTTVNKNKISLKHKVSTFMNSAVDMKSFSETMMIVFLKLKYLITLKLKWVIFKCAKLRSKVWAKIVRVSFFEISISTQVKFWMISRKRLLRFWTFVMMNKALKRFYASKIVTLTFYLKWILILITILWI